MCGNQPLKCGHKMFINRFIKKIPTNLRHLKGCTLSLTHLALIKNFIER